MITCIAIDDEPIALSIIQEYCRRIGDMELQTFTSPVAGMASIAETRPDIVFLDIEMNGYNGIALARQLPANCCLIFTTAYAQYALDGFEVDAVDFLHKPIFFPRFERAVAKARAWLDARREPQNDVFDKPSAEPNLFNDTIILKSEHKNVMINLGDIELVEAMDNYVKVFRRNLSTVISQITMKEMEEILPSDRFVRVHRSYIVALSAIDRFSSRQLYLVGHKQPIPVGRKYNEIFSKIYNSL